MEPSELVLDTVKNEWLTLTKKGGGRTIFAKTLG
jgi:hypothetical protein